MRYIIAILSLSAGFAIGSVLFYEPQDLSLGAPVLTTFQGGTGTSSPSGILYGDGTIRLKTVVIGDNLTFSSGVLSATAGGSGGTGTVGTSSVPTVGHLSYWTNAGTPSLLGSVATGTLSGGTGLSVTGSRYVIGGSATIGAATNYVIPLTASTTEWATAYGWGNHALAGYLTGVPFSTTSADHWKSVRDFFSTTSVTYWESTQSLRGASTTLLADTNTFTGPTRFATTTTSVLNGMVIVDGLRFTSDGAGIQNAINFAAAIGGGTVYVPSGIYTISTTIIVPFDSRVRLLGEKSVKDEQGGTILKANGTLTNLISVSGNFANTNADLSHDFALDNIYLDGNNTTNTCVLLHNVDFVKIQNFRIRQCTNAIKMTYSGVHPHTSSSAPGGVFIQTGSMGIRSNLGGKHVDIQNQTQIWISDVWFSGAASSTIEIASSTKVHISNVEFNTTDSAITLKDSADAATTDITVNNSVFAVGTGNKIVTDLRSNSSSARVAFSGNTYPNGTADSLFNTGQAIIQPFTTINNGHLSLIPNGTGFLGVGTATPMQYVDISRATAPVLRMSNRKDSALFTADEVMASLEFYTGDSPSARVAASMDWVTDFPSTHGTVRGAFRWLTSSTGAASEAMRLSNAGNLGLGTTSPYAKLSVVGQTVAEYFTATSTTLTSTFPLATISNATSSLSHYFSWLGTAAGTFLAVDATGKLIATTTPTSGGGTPGGSDTQIQFNDAGSFGGAALAYTEPSGTSATLTVGTGRGLDVISDNYVYLQGGANDNYSLISGTFNEWYASDGGGNFAEFRALSSGRFTFTTTAKQYDFYGTSVWGFLDFSSVASSNKTFSFPNLSGTVAIATSSLSAPYFVATSSVASVLSGGLITSNATTTNLVVTGNLTVQNLSVTNVTFSGDVDFSSATVTVKTYPAFTYATSSWSATTTVPLGVAFNAETWLAAKCYTDIGTVFLQFTDGTNHMNTIPISTTVSHVTLTGNNTFFESEKRYVNIGTPASSPTKVSCTVEVLIND
jgi:hypothetical protein